MGSFLLTSRLRSKVGYLLMAKGNPGKSEARKIVDQVDEVAELLANGMRPIEIRRYLAEQYGLSTRTSERRIADARQVLVDEASKIDRQQLAAQILSSYQIVLRKAANSNQLNNALGALSGIARLTGLEQKQN